MSEGEPEEEPDVVAQLSLQLGNLHFAAHVVTGRGRRTAAASASADAASAPARGAASPELSRRWAEARTASELILLPLPDCLLGLVSELPDLSVTWSARARLARAYRAGLQAREVLADLRRCVAGSPGLPAGQQGPSHYVVLRSSVAPQGAWTSSYSTYWYLAADPLNPRRFDPRGLSHSFLSEQESTAYLVGADRAWPLRHD